LVHAVANLKMEQQLIQPKRILPRFVRLSVKKPVVENAINQPATNRAARKNVTNQAALTLPNVINQNATKTVLMLTVVNRAHVSLALAAAANKPVFLKS
jgi:hypothetical protein